MNEFEKKLPGIATPQKNTLLEIRQVKKLAVRCRMLHGVSGKHFYRNIIGVADDLVACIVCRR